MLLFLAVGVPMGLDVIADLAEGAHLSHVAFHGVALALSVVGAGILWRRWLEERRARRDTEMALKSARQDVHHHREEAERWRGEAKEALAGLSQAIDSQFERWNLTRAEREVGLLLLKGLAFKEIASVRNTAERTVRQQANHLYKKADLSGRAELSAFFLEDLLIPGGGAEPTP